MFNFTDETNNNNSIPETSAQLRLDVAGIGNLCERCKHMSLTSSGANSQDGKTTTKSPIKLTLTPLALEKGEVGKHGVDERGNRNRADSTGYDVIAPTAGADRGGGDVTCARGTEDVKYHRFDEEPLEGDGGNERSCAGCEALNGKSCGEQDDDTLHGVERISRSFAAAAVVDGVVRDVESSIITSPSTLVDSTALLLNACDVSHKNLNHSKVSSNNCKESVEKGKRESSTTHCSYYSSADLHTSSQLRLLDELDSSSVASNCTKSTRSTTNSNKGGFDWSLTISLNYKQFNFLVTFLQNTNLSTSCDRTKCFKVNLRQHSNKSLKV